MVTNLVTEALPTTWRWAQDWRVTGLLFLIFTVLIVGLAVPRRWFTIGWRRASRYARAYRDWVARMGNRLDAVGLATVGPSTPPLEDVFVDVTLTSRAPGHVWPGVVGADVTGGRHQASDFLDQPDRVVLVVLGAPGSGKTTLLRHIARQTALTHGEKRRPVPVLLQLRESAPVIAAAAPVSLAALIRRSIPELPEMEPSGWWEAQLQAGRCLVLLDGLDEVADRGQRRAVVRWINEQLTVHPGNDFVVTSRPHGYRESFVDATATVQVLPFTRVQVETFLRGWYRTAERQANGSPERGDEAALHLIGQLRGMPGLADLTVNPLLLTLIAEVHRYGRRRGENRGLPDNRAALYAEMCDVMVHRRDEERELPVDLPRQRREILGRLAFLWMGRGVRSMGPPELYPVLRPWLSGTDPEGFIVEMERTGLLVAREGQEVAFAHQTFQEYLAARHLAEDEQRQSVLVAAVDDVWWRETTLLYVDLSDASDAVVTGCLESGSPNAMSLAFAIAESSEKLAGHLRRRLDKVLEGARRPGADSFRRAIAADVLVGRYLRECETTLRGSRIGRRPVGADLYDLFVMDTGTPAPDGPRGAGAARGMWRRDAEQFVAWLNGVLGEGSRGVTVRLPFQDEIQPKSAVGPVWTSNGRRTLLTSAIGGVLTVNARRLIDDAARDLRGSRLAAPALDEDDSSEHPVDRVLSAASAPLWLPPRRSEADDPVAALAAGLLPAHYPMFDQIPVDLDDLGELLEVLASSYIRRLLSGGGLDKVLDLVLRAAEPAIRRTGPISERDAAAVRVPALVLAGEARQTGNRKLASALVWLAAAVSLLQERARNTALLEVVYLAHD